MISYACWTISELRAGVDRFDVSICILQVLLLKVFTCHAPNVQLLAGSAAFILNSSLIFGISETRNLKIIRAGCWYKAPAWCCASPRNVALSIETSPQQRGGKHCANPMLRPTSTALVVVLKMAKCSIQPRCVVARTAVCIP